MSWQVLPEASLVGHIPCCLQDGQGLSMGIIQFFCCCTIFPLKLKIFPLSLFIFHGYLLLSLGRSNK